MEATDEPIASRATVHRAQPSYLSLPSTAPQRQRGGQSLGGAQGGGSWWLGWWLKWGKRDLREGACRELEFLLKQGAQHLVLLFQVKHPLL